ncbi:MAG: SPOR domain-containing protein, partial [Bacteroidota bacterium]
MPFIEESDLLELHKDIDKAQIINERLLDQIKFKNKDLGKLRLQRNVLLGITLLFVVGILAITSFTAGLSSKNAIENQNNLLVSIDSLDAIKTRIDNLKIENQELSLVREFYLAKAFLEKE